MASEKLELLCKMLGQMLGASVGRELPGIIEKEGDEKRVLELIDRNGGRLQLGLGLYSTEGIGDKAKLVALIPRQHSTILIDPGLISGKKPKDKDGDDPTPETEGQP